MNPDDMDNEHAVLFGKLRILRSCSERDLTDVELDGLMRYAAQHFTHEEALMGPLSSAERTNHCQAHEDIALRLIELKKANLRGGELRAELIDAIETWLTEHISTYDATLRAHLSLVE